MCEWSQVRVCLSVLYVRQCQWKFLDSVKKNNRRTILKVSFTFYSIILCLAHARALFAFIRHIIAFVSLLTFIFSSSDRWWTHKHHNLISFMCHNCWIFSAGDTNQLFSVCVSIDLIDFYERKLNWLFNRAFQPSMAPRLLLHCVYKNTHTLFSFSPLVCLSFSLSLSFR